MKSTRLFKHLYDGLANDGVVIVSRVQQDRFDNNYFELTFPADFPLVTQRDEQSLKTWYVMEIKHTGIIMVSSSLENTLEQVENKDVHTITQIYATITSIDSVRSYKSYKKHLAI